MLMSILRNFARFLASTGFRVSVLLIALVIIVLSVFGTTQAVKKTLVDSDAYETIANAIAKQATASETEADDGDQVLDQPEVQNAARDTFDADFVRDST